MPITKSTTNAKWNEYKNAVENVWITVGGEMCFMHTYIHI